MINILLEMIHDLPFGFPINNIISLLLGYMRMSSVQGGSVDPYLVWQVTMGYNRLQTMILCNMYIKTNLTFKLLLNDAL